MTQDEIKDAVASGDCPQNKALGYVCRNIVGWGGKIHIFNTDGDQYDSYFVTSNNQLRKISRKIS